MKFFAIGDLHLSETADKPMDVFGPEWADHPRKIARNWKDAVGEEDVVLLPGDLSWAMKLAEALPDLEFIEGLPGTKYFIRGNHDFWFSSPSKVRGALGPSTRLIRFDARVHGGVGICGVRGWLPPFSPEFDPEEDEKHWDRAIQRLELSLKELEKLDWDRAVAMFHYPPLDRQHTTALCTMVAEVGVDLAVYGHLHGGDAREAFEGEREGVTYRCVSADRLGFEPLMLFEL
mgnify:CR=1 FL=1